MEPVTPQTDVRRSLVTESRKAALAAAFTMLLWSSSFVAIRELGEVFSPATMALLRLAVAAAALSVFVLLRRGQPIRLSRKSFGLIAAYGVLWLGAYSVALNAGELHVDAGTAALLVNVAPLLVAFGAGLFLGEGFPKPLLIGAAVSFGGVALIAAGSSGRSDWIGVVLCLLAAVLYAAGVLIQKLAMRHTSDGLVITWLGCVIATVALLPWLPALIAELRTASAGAVLAGVYLGVAPTALGFSTWAYALKRTDAGKLSTSSYAVPALSVVLSWLLLSETPSIYGFVGGAVCLIGVAISRRRPR
ncbi:DMT family transporter [Saccharopolyspora griseoalba]|uniref:DMT family transporter n=1 Tax=Saccharopolyspora griseoalba TaxID=1431848 RepID=A0ABW2LMP5_9PSEU